MNIRVLLISIPLMLTNNLALADDFLCLLDPELCNIGENPNATNPSFLCLLDCESDITIINTSPTIGGVVGVPRQNQITRTRGESLRVIVKPKENFKGVVKINGLVVATGGVNRPLRHKYTVAGDSTIEISYMP